MKTDNDPDFPLLRDGNQKVAYYLAKAGLSPNTHDQAHYFGISDLTNGHRGSVTEFLLSGGKRFYR